MPTRSRNDRVQDDQAFRPAAPASPQQADVASDAPSAAGKLVVTPEVKAEIDTYLRKVAASGGDAWALAVARDGSKAAAGRCGNGAMAGCQKISNGALAARKLALSKCGIADCVLIYEGGRKIATVDIVVE